MAKKNFFGIRKGLHPETKETVINQVIEAPWDIAKQYVLGVKGAVYSGFATREEAENYINSEGAKPSTKSNTNTELTHKKDVLYFYVDGSFNKEIPNYGYGMVCVKNGKIVTVDKGAGNNKEAIEMYQIGGELLGAMKSLLFARTRDEKEIVIFHDYLGVGNHATGEWKRKTKFSEDYYQWMQNFFKENPEKQILFEKVDAHTGDDFNELADGYAKLSVNLTPDPIFYKMIEKYKI